MERSSLLLGGASGIPEAGVARLDGRNDFQLSPSALFYRGLLRSQQCY
jgi:hypothetical protein